MSTDFTWVGQTAWDNPYSAALNFSFAGGSATCTISGTSTAAFAPIVTFTEAGTSSTTFNGYRYGYQAGTTTIACDGSFAPIALAYLYTSTTINGVTTTASFPTQVFGGSTYSLTAPYLIPSFPTETFAVGWSEVTGTSTAAFDPYYSLTITAGATTDMRVGAMVTHPFSTAGEATSALTSQKLREGFYWSAGKTTHYLHIDPISQGTGTLPGTASTTLTSHNLRAGVANIPGQATDAFVLGGIKDSVASAAGQAYPTLVSASYHVATLTIYAGSTLLYYFGGMRTHPFSVAGAATDSLWSEYLRVGTLGSYGLTSSIGFSSDSRVQATRYETTHVLTEQEELYPVSVDDSVEVLLASEVFYSRPTAEVTPILTRESPLYIYQPVNDTLI